MAGTRRRRRAAGFTIAVILKKRLLFTDTVIPIARSMIEAGSGTQFDPDIVAMFLKIQDAFVEVKERFAECPQIIT